MWWQLNRTQRMWTMIWQTIKVEGHPSSAESIQRVAYDYRDFKNKVNFYKEKVISVAEETNRELLKLTALNSFLTILLWLTIPPVYYCLRAFVLAIPSDLNTFPRFLLGQFCFVFHISIKITPLRESLTSVMRLPSLTTSFMQPPIYPHTFTSSAVTYYATILVCFIALSIPSCLIHYASHRESQLHYIPIYS